MKTSWKLNPDQILINRIVKAALDQDRRFVQSGAHLSYDAAKIKRYLRPEFN